MIERPCLAPHVRLQWDPVRRRHQVVVPEAVHVLNESAAAVVSSCDGRPRAAILAALRTAFAGVDERDVWAWLERLERLGWLRESRNASVPRPDVTVPDIVASGAGGPPHAAPPPLCLVAEVTHRCPLRCPYCSNPLELVRARAELDTETWRRVLDEASSLGVAQVHFTGGEPLARRDLETLVGHAVVRGLYPHLVTGGTMATGERLTRLRDAGLAAIQLSLQDADPGSNDAIGGVASFASKREAVRAARALGLHVRLNVVLHRRNLDHVEEIVALARDWEVDGLELAHAQWTGWALHNRAALAPTAEQVERAEAVVETARGNGALAITRVRSDVFGGVPKACLGGWGSTHLTVAPDGAVLPCQSARGMPGLSFPNVRDASLAWVWNESPAFTRFRGTAWMPEPCRSCPSRERDFGGCRCQAWLLTGDPTRTDPACSLSPDHSRMASLRGSVATPEGSSSLAPRGPGHPEEGGHRVKSGMAAGSRLR